jgi:hypothetical protein
MQLADRKGLQGFSHLEEDEFGVIGYTYSAL